ncbi:hypothetical protein F5146DRAFT_1004375 [Armillaria mellea]|nr:hypothetical protein F5146DRAFT_1004375 [Armillaria mellea]
MPQVTLKSPTLNIFLFPACLDQAMAVERLKKEHDRLLGHWKCWLALAVFWILPKLWMSDPSNLYFCERRVDYPSREAENTIMPWKRSWIDSPTAVTYLTGLSNHQFGRLNTFNGTATKISEGVELQNILSMIMAILRNHSALPGHGRRIAGNSPMLIGGGSLKGVRVFESKE